MLTTSYNPQPPSWVAQMIQIGQERDAQQARGRQAAMEAELQHARRETELQKKQEFDMMQMQHDQANKDRAFAESNRRYAVENQPFTLPGGTVAAAPQAASVPAATSGTGVDLWNAGSPTAGPILGKITDYGQTTDPDLDSLTAGGKSAIGNLTPHSMAVSRDVEAQMKAAGIKIGQPVTLKLDDGSTVTRVWDDRTADVYKGQPIRGRFDLYSPEGVSPLRDKAVVGFSPAQVAIENIGQLPATKPVAAPQQAPVAQSTELSPAQQITSVAQDLAGTGLFNQKQARNILTSTAGAIYSAKARAASKTQTAEDLTSGLEPVPEHGTFRDRDGMEHFVSRTSDGKVKLTPYRPKELVAKRFGQGSDGNVYAYGSNGEPMQPVPDGVSVELNPGKIQTSRDNLGNVYQLHRDNTVSILIPAGVKMNAKDRDALVKDTEAFNEAKAEFETQSAALQQKGERGLSNWFGVSKSGVDEAKKKMDQAGLKMQSWLQQYPALKPPAAAPGAAPTEQPKPLDRDAAAKLLAEAGGDKERARQLAKDRGFTF